ncbi:MAG: GNAT family N-acetyltransferase [Marinibacterium sp.]|nr:GNAT family N-acetyltransferase [Marinibacterium sp.]
MSPIITRVQQADLPDLLPLVAALAAFHGDTPRADLAALRRDMLGRSPWMPSYVARIDGRAVGYASLLRTGQLQYGVRGMDLHHLYVVDDLRGQGIGAALLEAACRAARRFGAAYLVVGTDPDNHAAHRFYTAQGFARRDPAAPRFVQRLQAPEG